MIKEIYKSYSVSINDSKIGVQTIRLNDNQDNLIYFDFRSSIMNQDIEISSIIKQNQVIRYEKTESTSGKINHEKFELLERFNYFYKHNEEHGKIVSKFNFNFLEKVLYFPDRKTGQRLDMNKIINLKTMDAYDLEFIEISKNKLKLYSPEVAYIEYDEDGILSHYINLFTGIKIFEHRR